MRILIALLISLPLLAQEAATPPKPEEAKPAAAEAKKAESPVPAGESSISGTLDIGYRFVNPAGNFNVYRSVVNLGEGPKLFGADFTIQDPKHRLFDRLDVRADNWGGDPYNTLYVSAKKRNLYDFRADYRNISYFNLLPSFANPGTSPLGSEQTFDTRRRMTGVQLDLFPGRRIVPYLAFGRSSDSGRGLAVFVADANEFPALNNLSSAQDNYRGGVRLEMSRWHITLEQGGTTFKDDQQITENGLSPGNRTTPFLGRPQTLSNLFEGYRVRGDSIYEKALVTANPFPWLDVYGQFLYSQPHIDTTYNLAANGQLATLAPLLFYNGQTDLFSANSKMPHSSANAGFELRPIRRLRIIESWLTDRLHNSSASLLAETLTISPNTQLPQSPLALADLLVVNYNRQQVDVLFDITSHIILRGGYRYEWGDATLGATALTPAGVVGQLRRSVGLGGLTVRARQKLSINLDFEGAASDKSYFRTSLADYRRARIRANYQVLPSLSLGANFSILSNQNPSPTIKYDFMSRDSSVSLHWLPANGKHVAFLGEYTRSSLRSDIGYLIPQDLTPARSFYRDNAHTATALVDLALPAYGGLLPKLSFGGSLFVSSGSRPSNYYQPLARAVLPLHKYVALTGEWRYYGFAEQFYQYEGFRAHLFMTGLRFTR